MLRVPDRNGWLFALLALACASFGVLMLAGNSANAEVDYANRRRTIENLSDEEKARLQRNLDAFNRLPEETRAEYRRLHATLEENRAGRGDLYDLAVSYHEWAKTLSPWQRDELREIEDPGERVEKVREFLDGQRSSRNRERRFGRGDRPDFDREMIGRMMHIVEDSIGLSREERRELDELPPPVRHLRVLRQAVDLRGRGTQFRDDRTGAELMRELRDRPGFRLPGFDESDRPERRNGFLAAMLVQIVMREVYDEISRQRPSDEELERHFLELDRSTQDAIMRMPPEDQERMLVLRYLASRDDAFGRELKEILPQLERMIRRRSENDEWLPPGPPGPPRDDWRRPGDRRRGPGPPDGGPPPRGDGGPRGEDRRPPRGDGRDRGRPDGPPPEQP